MCIRTTDDFSVRSARRTFRPKGVEYYGPTFVLHVVWRPSWLNLHQPLSLQSIFVKRAQFWTQ